MNTEIERLARRRRKYERRERKASRDLLPALIRRNGGTCFLCPQSFRPILVPHHIRFLEHGGESWDGNLIAVCPTCHALIHHFSRERWQELEDRIGQLRKLGFSLEKAEQLLAIATEEVATDWHNNLIHRARVCPGESHRYRNELAQLGVRLEPMPEPRVRPEVQVGIETALQRIEKAFGVGSVQYLNRPSTVGES